VADEGDGDEYENNHSSGEEEKKSDD